MEVMWKITRPALGGARLKGNWRPLSEELHQLFCILMVQCLRAERQGSFSAMVGKKFTSSRDEYGCRGSFFSLTEALLYWVDVNTS